MASDGLAQGMTYDIRFRSTSARRRSSCSRSSGVNSLPKSSVSNTGRISISDVSPGMGSGHRLTQSTASSIDFSFGSGGIRSQVAVTRLPSGMATNEIASDRHDQRLFFFRSSRHENRRSSSTWRAAMVRAPVGIPLARRRRNSEMYSLSTAISERMLSRTRTLLPPPTRAGATAWRRSAYEYPTASRSLRSGRVRDQCLRLRVLR